MKKNAEGEKAVEMFQLVKENNLLPANMDDLARLSFIGGSAVSFYRKTIRAMNNLKVAEERRKATLKDGQDAGEMLLDIEARIGELLPGREDAQKLGRKIGKTPGVSKVLPEGITRYTAKSARIIAENPEIVATVKAQARDNDDIATKTAVLKAIRHKKAQENKTDVSKNKNPEDSSNIAALELASYLKALDKCIRLLPEKIPADLNEQAFSEARVKVKIIVHRLLVFLEKNAPKKTDEHLQQA